MKFVPLDESYRADGAAQEAWPILEAIIGRVDGVAFYKNPAINASGTKSVPDFTALARGFQPIVLRILAKPITEIESISGDDWTFTGGQALSPITELEDFEFGLQSVFGKRRELRGLFSPLCALRLSLIGEREFTQKFPDADVSKIWFRDTDVRGKIQAASCTIDDTLWSLSLSVFQGLDTLNGKKPLKAAVQTRSLGEALEILKNRIALFDQEQLPAAMQLPKGPQRIRGLAGTGKTVVLAMKAATIHAHEPDAKILFTFNTQSLYNQIQNLITEFYRIYGSKDPDWEKLQVLHGWGGKQKPGVYYNLCRRYETPSLTLRQGQSQDYKIPFRACCNHALQLPLVPEYDYVLIDEAQDFPPEFFQVVYRLTKPPSRIYWAYDEFQTLSDIKVPSPEDLFGVDANKRPRLSLEQADADGLIERDIVLKKSYRCPREILMVAHAVGLGIHRRGGPIQMVADDDSWRSLGYEVTGQLKTGQQVIIQRPDENSPNPIRAIYSGEKPIVSVTKFADDTEELTRVADRIIEDVRTENIKPEDILVISLDHTKVKLQMSMLSRLLLERGLKSTVPGLVDSADAFGLPNHVTLSTVYRAKGNEAFIVYILSFEALYDYVEEIPSRNRAFTSISRAKGLVRISGIGDNMTLAQAEVERIRRDLPHFKFVFPDMTKLKQLDVETTRRKRQESRFRDYIKRIQSVDPEILKSNKDELKALLESLESDPDENQ